MDNPIKALRDERGWDRGALAFALGVSYDGIARVELGLGRNIPRRWDAALRSLGADPDAMRVAYQAWRDSARSQLLEG